MPVLCSVKPVYGAQHPPLMFPAASSPTKGTSGMKAAQARYKKPTSFDDFKTKTSDAWEESDPWDAGEPDDVDPADTTEVESSPQPGQAEQSSSEGVSGETRDRKGSGRTVQHGDRQQGSGTGRSTGRQHGRMGELLDRDAVRLQKFEKLLAGPSTELGKAYNHLISQHGLKLCFHCAVPMVYSVAWKLTVASRES